MRHMVFLEQYGSLGGGQQVLLELVRAALALPCRVSVLIPAGPCVDKLKGMGATVRLIPACRLSQGKKNYADMVRFATYSWRIFLQHMGLLRSADLIYINGNRLLGTGMLAQLFLRRRAACHIHLNHGPMEQKLFLLFLKSRKSLALIVPSDFILKQLQAAYSGVLAPCGSALTTAGAARSISVSSSGSGAGAGVSSSLPASGLALRKVRKEFFTYPVTPSYTT